MSSFQLMQLAMNSARISLNKTNRAGVRVLKAVYLEAEATIKMPRITEDHADHRVLARAVKCLATNPTFNGDVATGIQEVLDENTLPKAALGSLRHMLIYIRLVPHLWKEDPWRAWTLLTVMKDDGRISNDELETLTMLFAAGIDVDAELERAMEQAEQGKVNEDELLTVADELKAMAEWKKLANHHGAYCENTSAK